MNKLIKYISILMFAFPVPVMPQYYFSADDSVGCDSLTVHFTFTSTASVDTITFIIWDLGNGKFDTTQNISETVTTTYYYNPSPYPVIVYINDLDNGEPFIKDNYIHVHHSVTADFTVKDTSQLAPFSYSFSDASLYFDNSTTFTYGWDFGDGNTGTGMNAVHTYASDGTYNASLSIVDGYGCTSTSSQSITVNPLADITASLTEGCDSLRVKFNLIDVDTDTISSISWDFGNGQTSNNPDPDTVLYMADDEQPVSYFSIRVIINGDSENAIQKTNLITVHRSVKAIFECKDTIVTSNSIIKVCYNLDPLFDTSAIYEFEWNVEGFETNDDVRPVYTFANSYDTVPASLTIRDLTYGCSDSSSQMIIVMPETPVQNVFTPNGDGINEYFIISTGGTVHLQIKIFSRSGLLVYQSEGTEIVWDGKSPSGVELAPGIYYYVLSSISGDPDGKYNKTGFVYLLK